MTIFSALGISRVSETPDEQYPMNPLGPSPPRDFVGPVNPPPDCGKLFPNIRRTISDLPTDTAHGATDESISSPQISSAGMSAPQEMCVDDFNPWATHVPVRSSDDAFGVYMVCTLYLMPNCEIHGHYSAPEQSHR
jgi:hypothetical protein